MHTQQVDSIAAHKVFSFIDAYSGYHQIKMAEGDKAKTAFRTPKGNFCYKMMPFGLKNAGVTYQRMVNEVFKSQIGWNIEAYIDDMVIKTKENNHLLDLAETFETMRRNSMKLNPSKCTFGVTARNFLGFLVNRREIQRLNGRIFALGRFISKSAERCLPFFKVLKGGKKFEWDEECRVAFEEIKAYLGKPPLLCSPVEGEELFMYLAASDYAVAAVLVREDGGIQRPVY